MRVGTGVVKRNGDGYHRGWLLEAGPAWERAHCGNVLPKGEWLGLCQLSILLLRSRVRPNQGFTGARLITVGPIALSVTDGVSPLPSLLIGDVAQATGGSGDRFE